MEANKIIEQFEVKLSFKVTAKIPIDLLESLERVMVEDGFSTARDYLVDMAAAKFRAANLILSINGENTEEATKSLGAARAREDAEGYSHPEPYHPDMDEVIKAIMNNKDKIIEFWNSIDLGESAILLDKPDEYQI